MVEIWECYGHGRPGIALVSAFSRALAVRACFEWLGWRVGVAFRKPERFTLWVNCGGAAERPVVYAEDGEHYAAVERRLGESNSDSEYGEDKL